jgi:hypothetical protein
MKKILARIKHHVIRLYYLRRCGNGAFPIKLKFDQGNLHFTSHAGGYEDLNKDYVDVLVYDTSGAYTLPFTAITWNREHWNTIRDQVDGMFNGLAEAKTHSAERMIALEKREDEAEKNLKSILANPVLTAEAFPDPEMRKKILPLFQYLREIGRKGARTQEV